MIETAATPLRPPSSALWSTATVAERATLIALVAIVGAASWYLLPFWREMPELSHGYFAPICALALLWQSRRESAPSRTPGSGGGLLLQTLLAGAGVTVAVIAAFAALAQGPLHPQTAFLAGILVSILLISAVSALAAAPSHALRLNGASGCAALLWWFVVPLPSGTLARFTLFLQDAITAGSVQTLHLFGMPAVRHGNVIELANTLVGVEEACSGIRSLTACLFAGVVLGGLMLPGIVRRVGIVLGAGAIAIAANFVRSIALCLMAARGIEIKGFWHDATAYAVLGATALILFGGCLLLAPKSDTVPAESATSPAPGRRWPLAIHGALTVAFAALIGLVGWKIVPTSATERPPPDLQNLLVLDTSGWTRRSDDAIQEFSAALNTPHLRQETYFRGDTRITFYFAFWPASRSTLGSVALHTPDICAPGGGWAMLAPPRAIAAYPLPAPSRFLFEKDEFLQHVWFWHYFDGRQIRQGTGLLPWQLAPTLLRQGVSARAPQWVVRVSSNKPLETLLGEPILHEFFQRLRAAELAGVAVAQ